MVHSSRFGLAFFLLHEAKNTSSFWRPYLCALPRRPAAPFLLKSAELRELLKTVVASTFLHTYRPNKPGVGCSNIRFALVKCAVQGDPLEDRVGALEQTSYKRL